MPLYNSASFPICIFHKIIIIIHAWAVLLMPDRVQDRQLCTGCHRCNADTRYPFRNELAHFVLLMLRLRIHPPFITKFSFHALSFQNLEGNVYGIVGFPDSWQWRTERLALALESLGRTVDFSAVQWLESSALPYRKKFDFFFSRNNISKFVLTWDWSSDSLTRTPKEWS